jgi:hypothetical protein
VKMQPNLLKRGKLLIRKNSIQFTSHVDKIKKL